MTAWSRAAAPKLSEREVTKQVIDWLKAEKWRCYRLQSGLVRGKTRGTFMTLGEPGLPDWFCVRGRNYFFLEIKAPRKKRTDVQRDWCDRANMEAIPQIWCDSLDMFLDESRSFLPFKVGR